MRNGIPTRRFSLLSIFAVIFFSAPVKAWQDLPRERLLVSTYYDVQNFEGSLLLNNKGPHIREVEVTLWNLSGESFQMKVREVDGNSVLRLDLAELVSEAGRAFQKGRIELVHRGKPIEIGAQIVMTDREDNLIFSEQLVNPSTKFSSNRLEGLWWLPRSHSNLQLVLANRRLDEITVELSLLGPGATANDRLVLGPGQIRLVSLQNHSGLERGGLPQIGGITIRHSGDPGDLMARALVADRKIGFSSHIEFIDPSTAVSSSYHGAGLRLGRFLEQRVDPVILVRNQGNEAACWRNRFPMKMARFFPWMRCEGRCCGPHTGSRDHRLGHPNGWS